MAYFEGEGESTKKKKEKKTNKQGRQTHTYIICALSARWQPSDAVEI